MRESPQKTIYSSHNLLSHADITVVQTADSLHYLMFNASVETNISRKHYSMITAISVKSLLPALLWCSLPGARGGVHHLHGVDVEAWDLWPLVSPVLGNITEQCYTASLEYITLLNRTRAVNELSR